ncbi:ATP-binding cassette domain-containing protein [Streptomyces sp. ActVer]|uniref:ABC transporter ATP-binding protein n=1 Tax=Streptomyces sp. ActVer TaxID=3014558 RepID=UPI0022B4B6E5|nr:ABC transporter ATP-binding protein [Streptomyces sp. ActVer]MCZ4508061.1 ATP-binding cassette domain-containing protein [Streptomyces sp. ActVer]
MTAPAPVDLPMPARRGPLVVVEDLVKHFPVASGLRGKRRVHSVDGVSLEIARGEVLGLVGESGCGKSTLARTLLGLTPADSGRVLFDGTDIARTKGRERKALRRSMQLVFQDPLSAFDPKMRLGTSLEAPLAQHGLGTREERGQRIAEVLEQVGLDESFVHRLPRECSGGQLQRAVVARALLLQPRFLVCDEPTSALDASNRAHILNLLGELKDQLGLTLLMISHDLRVVRHICDRVAVMYLGKVIEVAPRHELFEQPAHPYTQALLASSLPDSPEARGTFSTLKGEPPSPLSPPAGCRFHTRCPKAQQRCGTQAPAWSGTTTEQHQVACHFPGP